MATMTRKEYAAMYGPTKGDAVRLGDTSLLAEVEFDYSVPGDECLHGGGKTLRDGMGLMPGHDSADGALDMLICNALIMDPVIGIVKGDIGIKDGKIVAIGKAGNPQIMDGVHTQLICGVATTVRDAEGLIVTPGGIDVHVHFDSAQLCEHALAAGLTTLIGGSLGPITVGIDCGGEWNVGKMLQAAEAWPINFGFLGRGNSSKPESLLGQLRGGCLGLKIHEDWGAMPAVIDTCLKVADEYDFQVQLHTDTLNESGFLEDTLAAIGDRTIHMYHTEGAGGGHAPDIISVAGKSNCIPSSTNPTNPYTVNTFDEHLDMIMVCHHLNPDVPEDVAFAESRVRPQTIAAEDILHDTGSISILGSDSQGMGRINEVICRTWQLASKMKDQRGRLPEETTALGDNERIKRYIAKYTINAARVFGIDSYIGSLEPGKLADLVLWRPAFFGIKPELVVKGGFIVHGVMGDSAASLYTCEPLVMRPQWGAFGEAKQALSVNFVNRLAVEADTAIRLGLKKQLLPAFGTRTLRKSDMLHNDACPDIRVDPQTFDVYADGERLYCEPVSEVPLAQRYMLR
ncbi:Urease subunit alpha [Pseudomonas amygdali pv. eriobotryae]|uniref:Urease subunit alpha n=1 Tax=Pseudomonas amygdali pv. eriobotryae TaxID=129137 RepID=A0A0P9SA32_PSEA0|nr:urease subunit alpha [Pseudomonas amygdali]KPX22629.1 Urease subunit alpha [Pseudomonas amygdali pv. eriobotryae]KWS80774.1 urease subunit alpha [Pseudomonas amygdali pv. eriobotryae]RMM01768.1 Urease subunit alpha [Pseudomonas amygdali pv. eriobotryae]GFZ72143.1 urease subunit alpha 1 [Pseudomonas amygdali pv. eriobotryae]